MNAITKRLPSPGIAIACIALAVALGGASYAAFGAAAADGRSAAAADGRSAAAADGRSAAAACKPGNTTYQGVRARIYCGSASAVVKVGGRSLTYRGGSCMRNRVAVELGIGTIILDARDPKTLPRSFGISVGRIFGIGKPARTDGTHKSGMLAYVDAGKRYAAAQVTTTLRGGRSRGSFTGKLLTGEAVKGTFRCS